MPTSRTTARLPRRSPARISTRPGVLSAALLPILLTACGSDSPAAPPQPVSALYQCRGEPGYSGTWEDVLKSANHDSVLYCAPPPADQEGQAHLRNEVSTDTLDTLRMHTLVLDGQCRFLEEFDDSMALRKGAPLPSWRWSGRLADGSTAPSGEYFLNTVWKRPDGGEDTTWAKIGMLRRCGG